MRSWSDLSPIEGGEMYNVALNITGIMVAKVKGDARGSFMVG